MKTKFIFYGIMYFLCTLYINADIHTIISSTKKILRYL